MAKEITTIYPDLYQFTEVVEPIKLSIHQYLVLAEEPVLIQTGAIDQAEKTIPQIKQLLGGKQLKYILVSHFESDECGGLALVLREYPNVITVCSEVTARQIWGFGLARNVEIKKPGDKLTGKDFEFTTISYPSEMHLWEGVMFMETKRRILFSSDLMFSMGETHGQIIESSWTDALKTSGVEQLPSPDIQKKMLDDLKSLNPVFVASGHGPCIKITG
jgi:flavorubredoxin